MDSGAAGLVTSRGWPLSFGDAHLKSIELPRRTAQKGASRSGDLDGAQGRNRGVQLLRSGDVRGPGFLHHGPGETTVVTAFDIFDSALSTDRWRMTRHDMGIRSCVYLKSTRNHYRDLHREITEIYLPGPKVCQ